MVPRGGPAEGGQEPPRVVDVGEQVGAERGMDVAECQIMNRFFGSLSRDSLAR